MSNQKILIAVAASLVAIGTLALQANPPSEKESDGKQFPLLRQQAKSKKLIAGEEVVPLMHRKLNRAKEMLEGLALEDHGKIAKSARALKVLSLEAGWKVIQTNEYMQQSSDFRRACDLIENAAKENDASRAALCYVALTVRCVECHNYLRNNKVILAGKAG